MPAFAKRMDGVSGSAIRELMKLMVDPEIISFGGGNPSKESFPIEFVSEMCQEILKEEGASVLQYGTSEGYMPLRQSYLEHLKKNKNVYADVENIMITTGSMQGMDLLTKAFIDPGDAVLVESPTFLGAIQGLHAFQANCIPVEMDEEGVMLSDLEAKMKQYHPKLFYCIPTFQNPTGKTLGIERRQKIAELASKYDVMIAEDDPYCELRYEGEPIPPIKSFDQDGHVVLLNSFSKILSPGLRVGVAVGDATIIRKMTILKQSGDTHTTNLTQAVCDRFLRKDMLPGHLKGILPSYKVRLDAMLDGIQRFFPENVKFTHPEGGLFVWVEIPVKKEMVEIAREAATSLKVAFVPGEHFYVDPNMGKNTMRLNFSSATPEQITTGLERLGNLLKQYS